MTEDETPPTRRRENTRQRLLDAAAEVFAEVGLDAASVEAVCERAGFTRGAFYSNFATKEELFLELAARVATQRIEAVRRRVDILQDDCALDGSPMALPRLVGQVLDAAPDDRLGVLLMSEIRLHALRNPELADAFLRQDEEMVRSVAQIVSDLTRAQCFAPRVSAEETARILLLAWEGTATRGFIAGLSSQEVQQRLTEQIGVIVGLLVPDES